MKQNNSLIQAGNQKITFSSFINSQSVRGMIEKSVKDPQTAASLVSTLISVVSSNEKLKQCDGNSIIAAALRGEVGMGLSLALGQYAIVPYGDKASFQIQERGLRQLAIRSGKYDDLDVFEVRQGEYEGRDERTGKPRFKWIEDEDDREQRPIIGYYAYYILNAANNHFYNCVYWTHDKILRHADRYSKAFDLAKYNDLIAGKLSKSDAEYLRSGSPWYDLPDSVPHQKMCKKTVMKQLLSDGSAPMQVRDMIFADNLEERTEEPVIYADDPAPVQPVEREQADVEAPVEKPAKQRAAKKESEDAQEDFFN